MARYDNIMDTIGGTPLVRIRHLAPPGVSVYAKLESFNPMGSVCVDAEAERFVDEVLAGDTVVMFALKWCEFCWSVRKLFERAGIAYRSVDLDAVEMQQDDLGGRVRGVLAARTGATTIPQIYIAGWHVGGYTDLLDAWRDGTVQERLATSGVRFDRMPGLDPYSLLPKWLQPRRSA